MNFHDYLDNLITTTNLGQPSNWVGTRYRRRGDKDAHITLTPKGMEPTTRKGKKKKKPKRSKKRQYLIQKQIVPGERSGKYILTPDYGG